MKKRNLVQQFTIASALVAVFLVGCTANSEEPATSRAFSARFDQETGEAILPVEQFRPSESDIQISDAAIYLGIELCLGEKGYPVYWADPADYPLRGPMDRYPSQDLEHASKHGARFDEKSQHQDYLQWAEEHSEVVTSDQYDADMTKCAEESDFTAPKFTSVTSFENTIPSEVAMVGSASYQHMRESAEGKEAIEEWAQCLTERGLVYEQGDAETIGGVKGYSEARNSEKDIQMALKQVQCSLDTKLAERLSAIEAEYQSPIVAKYENELVEIRNGIDELVKLSEEYIKANKGKLEQYRKNN